MTTVRDPERGRSTDDDWSDPERSRLRLALSDAARGMTEAKAVLGYNAWWASGLRWLASAVAFYFAVQVLFGSNEVSPFNLVQGLSVGALYGIIGVGIILIYRTSRIINFAAGAIGAVPAIIALILDLEHHINYLAVLPIALIGGPALAAAVDVVIMRRFDRSPRLITTVVTIGVAQSLAVLGFFIPIWLGQKANNEGALVPTPWDRFVLWHNNHGQAVMSGNDLAAFIVVIALTVGLGFFLRYTRIGIALRASAENADRALLLGIPVQRVATVAWAGAGLLSAMAIFVQAPLIGTPSDASLGFDTLLYGLTAAIVARMERFGVALATGLAIGVLITSSIIRFGDDNVAAAIMLPIILVALLAQRKTMARAKSMGEGTWQTVKQFRPIPSELRNLPEVVRARFGLTAAAVILMAVLPYLPWIGGPNNYPYLALLPLYGIIAVSLVVLTGWAGQISLGQFGFVGLAAGVAGGLVAKHNIDFFTALAIGVVTGVVAAVLIGLPAVRIQGLYLAVATLAFSYAVEDYALNSQYPIGRLILPASDTAHLYRPVLYGIIDLTSFSDSGQRNFYYVCAVFLGLSMLCAYAFRRNRSGRILIAARDNDRAAPAYAINLARTRLAAFAVSGGIAGLAGVLFAYDQGNVVAGTYDPQYSILIFLAAAAAGISSIGWTVFGVMFLEVFVVYGHRLYASLGQNLASILPQLLTGPGLLLSMYFYPGGSAQNGFDRRDAWLRRVAERRHLLVPSLVADRRVDEQEQALIVEAEHHVSETPLHDPSDESAVPVGVGAGTSVDHDLYREKGR
jgi:branched-chain amino acid transport system permease protein